MHRVLAIGLIASTALLAQKPSREIQELQRDVAQLSEEVRGLKQALDQRVGAVSTQMEAMTKSLGQLNDSMAAVRKSVEEQDRKLTPQIAAQGSRIDQMATNFSTVQQALADLTSGINRLQTQIVDLGNVVKVISTPAPKPPSAEELLKTADADRLGGKYELAAQGYSDFLKTYADAPEADIAQFQLGAVHFQMKNMESAARDFDSVVRNYPKSQRVPESLFYKSRALEGLGRKSESAAACAELRRRFPKNEFARQCGAPAR